jgi:hypothetical protein
MSGRRYPTQAYTVVCQQEHAHDVDEMLKNIFKRQAIVSSFACTTRMPKPLGKPYKPKTNTLHLFELFPLSVYQWK